MKQLIESFIRQFHDESCRVIDLRQASGGCIHNSYVVVTGTEQYFIKLNQSEAIDVLKSEYDALMSLSQLQSHVRYPKPFAVGEAEQTSLLLMEYLPIQSMNSECEHRLGEALALQHRELGKRFGWHQDNYLGLSQQSNREHRDWVSFFKTERLGFQFKLAMHKGCDEQLLNLGDDLMADLDKFFIDYKPQPSLLHGDLWAGNAGGYEIEPFLFDPAVYYGDRETDIAMTELFGGFSNHFYQAYNANWPLDKGYKKRKPLYNLYHILNHFNLFGGGYQSQAISMIQQLLK